MKLSERQLKRIIRKTITESGDIYPRPQHPMIAQAQANNHENLLARAVQACLEAGMSPKEICALCEYEAHERDM